MSIILCDDSNAILTGPRIRAVNGPVNNTVNNSTRKPKARSGLTLLELLLAMLLALILSLALTYAFVAGLNMQRNHEARKAAQNQTGAMEQRITQMLEGAKITTTATDTTTFFIGDSTGQGNTNLGCDQLIFSTTSPGVPQAAQNDQDDFETQQTANGPIGGIAEVSFGTTAVGDPGNRTGLFERIQRPSDGDPTQGGMESLLSPNVQQMGFQFWDGTQWLTAWDTRTGQRRLPAAVKVSYVLQNAPDNTPHVFIVRLPNSDTTVQNPVTNAGGTQ